MAQLTKYGQSGICSLRPHCDLLVEFRNQTDHKYFLPFFYLFNIHLHLFRETNLNNEQKKEKKASIYFSFLYFSSFIFSYGNLFNAAAFFFFYIGRVAFSSRFVPKSSRCLIN